MIVVDCSYAMAMVLPDEQQPRSLQRVLAAQLFAPPIWPVEVANALRNVVRRQRLHESQIPALCARLEDCEVELLGTGDAGVHSRYLAARQHDLSAYDATYLDLALQRRCALATLDARLAEAAQRAGVAVLD
jgi:predicted nucleic acid-binding protein